MITLFEKNLYENILSLKSKKVIVAFSGGKDSSALLDFVYDKSVELNMTLSACHVNHNLRIDSARDEKFCNTFCNERSIPLVVKSLDVLSHVRKYGCSIEESARILRYSALNETCDEIGADCILLAHNRDDVVENFFIKTFQGTSIFNLKGFNKRDKILRPMLDIPENAVYTYLSEKGIDYIVDITNSSPRFLRNWVRNNIVKEIKDYKKGYINNILKLQEYSEELRDYFLKKIKNVILIFKSDLLTISLEKFIQLEKLEQNFLIIHFFSYYFRVEKKHVELINSLLKKKGSARVDMPSLFHFEKSYSCLSLYRKELVSPFKIFKNSDVHILDLIKYNKRVVFSGKMSKEELLVRNRKPGDRFRSKKLKDLFIDKKIDLFVRDTSVLVEKQDDIVWVENISDNNENIQVISIEG